MFRSGVAALCVAVFLAVFEIGSCTLCYQCSSQSDKTCGDPFYVTSKKPVDCNLPNATDFNREYLSYILPSEFLIQTRGARRACHKIVTNTGTVARTCLDVNPVDLNETCRVFSSKSNGLIKYCGVCDKDFCNGASGIAISFPLAALALVASYLFYLQ